MKELLAAEKTFWEELQVMPYFDRCLVLGLVLGTRKSEMAQTLHVTVPELELILIERNLNRWLFLRALLDA